MGLRSGHCGGERQRNDWAHLCPATTGRKGMNKVVERVFRVIMTLNQNLNGIEVRVDNKRI